MGQLHILDPVETQALFKFLDKNRDGKIGYAEFLESFSAMNTQDYLNQLRSFMGEEEPKAFFERQCRKDKVKAKMFHDEFFQMIKPIFPTLVIQEKAHLCKHFDKVTKGYITTEEFIWGLGKSVRDTAYNVVLTAEDIFKPMANRSFDINDMFKDIKLLGSTSLKDALVKQKYKELSSHELATVDEYLKAKYNSTRISKEQFELLLRTKWDRNCDDKEARQALLDLQKRFEKEKTVKFEIDGKLRQLNLQLLLKHFSVADELTTGDFKVALGSIRMFGQYDLDNMAKYLDIKNTGWLKMGEVMDQIKAAASVGGPKHQNKWVGKDKK